MKKAIINNNYFIVSYCFNFFENLVSHHLQLHRTPTDNPINESLNGWIKEELFIDFDLKHCSDVPKLIEEYVYYYNYERPSYALNYKTPIQYKIESGF